MIVIYPPPTPKYNQILSYFLFIFSSCSSFWYYIIRMKYKDYTQNFILNKCLCSQGFQKIKNNGNTNTTNINSKAKEKIMNNCAIKWSLLLFKWRWGRGESVTWINFFNYLRNLLKMDLFASPFIYEKISTN